MNRHASFIILFICLWAVFFICPSVSAQAQPTLQLLEDTPSHKVYEWTAPEWAWRTIMADGKTFLMPDSNATLLWMQSGYPVLPMISLSLTLPAGQRASISLTDTVFVRQELAAPLYFSPEENPAASRPGDELHAFFPKRILQSSFGTSRQTQILQLTLFPVQWQESSTSVRYLRYARIHVRINQEPLAKLTMRADPPQWRKALQSYLKLYLLEEGPYQLSGADVESAEVSLSDVDPATLQLFVNGVEQPIELVGCEDGRLDPTDRILLYGRARRGDHGEFYHDYSDTMVYWLTWGGPPGKRYEKMAAPENTALVDFFADSLHYEKDISFYSGDSDSDIHNSEKVSGEGWVWAVISRNGSAVFNFAVPDAALEQDSLVLRMRIRGTTLDAQSPDHHVQISLNNTMVHELWFDDRDEKLLRFLVPRELVRKPDNALTVRLLGDTPSERSQIYVDWIKVDYRRQTRLQDGWLDIAAPEKSHDVYVSGFTSEDAHVWDTAAGIMHPISAMGKMWLSRIEVRSAGYADGDYAYFLREGQVVSTGTRGINLWYLDPVDGRVVEQKKFDTYASSEQSDSMAVWIQRLPVGALVVASIRDEGSVKLTESARLALENLGSSRIRELGVRDSWAMIGEKGKTPGSVLEVLQKSKSGSAVVKSKLFFRDGGPSNAVRVPLPAAAIPRLVVFDGTAARQPLRVVKYQDKDLRSGGQGADYILITHTRFLTEAKHLADYRARTNGWRTMVVDVESIYDEFADGLASPDALKKFIQHAYQNWAQPAPAFVLFFGDASWDPKNNYKVTAPTEFVPTYGSPVSDNWFVCVDGPEDVLPDLWPGRIPVKSPEEAAASVAKIVAFEQGPSGDWRKNFLFISGGFDFIEQGQFGQQSKRLIADFVESAPTCGSGLLLHKSSEGYQEGEHRQEILDTIDQGVAWVNFIGHAGSRTWDLMFHNVDIDALDNHPRLPFITSMTCHTGRFAEPNQTSFGEYFVMVPEKGAIGFMGTSGWGYSYEDYTFLRKLFPLALQDTVRHLGELVSKAKVRLWQDAAANKHILDMVYQYNLLGDPAVQLAVPDRPDLTIQATEIFVQPEIPSEADSSAQICAYVRNFGLKTSDSVTVQISTQHPNIGGQILAPRLRVGPVCRLDSVIVKWPLRNMAGNVEIIAAADPENKIYEFSEDNNTSKRTTFVMAGRIDIVVPTSYSVVPAENVTIKLIDSQSSLSSTKIYKIEIDTSKTFTSPALQFFRLVDDQGPVIACNPFDLLEGQSYFVRTLDSSQHKNIWRERKFTTAFSDEYGWMQYGTDNFNDGIFINVQSSDEAVLSNNKIRLYAESAGYNDGNFARIIIKNDPAVEPHRGHNIAVVDAQTGLLKSTNLFDTYSDSSAANRMAKFIEKVELGDYVLAAIMDEGSVSMTESAFQALESIGSNLCRLVSPRDSWSIVGIKGAAKGTVREKLSRSRTGSAVAVDTIEVLNDSGTLLSPRIGAAARWHSLRADGDIPAECTLDLDVLGQRRNTTQWDTLRTRLALNQNHDISSIPAQLYPFLRLRANFRSLDRLHTPNLSSWRVYHDPVADLAVSPAYLSLSADSVLSGEDVVLKLDLFNIGLAAADSVQISFAETIAGAEERIFSRLTLTKPLESDQSAAITQLYTPSGRPGLRLLTVRIDADNFINELSEANNVLTAQVHVVADTTRPHLDVTFDGRAITSGELVSNQPVIEAMILDNSPLAVQDTLLINVLLDGKRLAFVPGSGSGQVSLTTAGGKTCLRFSPLLNDGEHWLEIYYADASGNANTYTIAFRVISDLQVLEALNYPNPFIDNTTFTFDLTQSAHISIRIYTVNGRLIRVLEAGERTPGFNQVPWDGRDEEGDVIANGVYLYRVLAQSGEHRAEALQKAILMR